METAPCVNATVCRAQEVPRYILDDNGGWCTSCNSLFNTVLTLKPVRPCVLCRQSCPDGAVIPGCHHELCVDCFHWCFYHNHELAAPPFPYPDRLAALEVVDDMHDMHLITKHFTEWFSDAEMGVVLQYMAQVERVEWFNHQLYEGRVVQRCPECQHRPVCVAHPR